jgi:hypothetical protein
VIESGRSTDAEWCILNLLLPDRRKPPFRRSRTSGDRSMNSLGSAHQRGARHARADTQLQLKFSHASRAGACDSKR